MYESTIINARARDQNVSSEQNFANAFTQIIGNLSGIIRSKTRKKHQHDRGSFQV